MSELRHPEKLYSVHPSLGAFARKVAAESPHDWLVVTGIRALSGVAEKYAVGRTTPGPHSGDPGYPQLGLTITNVATLEGAPHAERMTPEGVWGCAVDMQFLLGPGKLSPGESPEDQAIYRWYGELAESLGLVWGGRFSKVDQAHVELPGWRKYPLPKVAGNV